MRRPETRWHDLAVLLAGATAVLWVWAAAMAVGADEAPPKPSPSVTTDSREFPPSRSAPRELSVPTTSVSPRSPTPNRNPQSGSVQAQTTSGSPSTGAQQGVGAGDPSLWPGATSVWDSQPAWVVEWAACNVRYESWNAGTYTAENPISTASGVGQWLDGTWAAHVANSGIPVDDTSHAANNTPEQQDRVLAWAARFAYGAWTHGCPRY